MHKALLGKEIDFSRSAFGQHTHTHLETLHASTAMVGYPPFVCMRVLFELSFHISAFEGFAFF